MLSKASASSTESDQRWFRTGPPWSIEARPWSGPGVTGGDPTLTFARGRARKAGRAAPRRASLRPRSPPWFTVSGVPARTMLVVLDGCDRDVATALAAAGTMPHLARLLEDAASVPTVAPRAGLFVSGIWPTMFTARRPEHHGYTCWVGIEPSTYADRGTSPREAEGAPFWEHLTHAGLRSALIDVPHSWPSPDHDGVMVCEWSGHDRHFGLRSWPPGRGGSPGGPARPPPSERAGAQSGTSVRTMRLAARRPHRHRTADELTTMRDLLVRGIETKTAASLEYLGEDDWDLFVSVVGETHCSGHQFWHLHDQDARALRPRTQRPDR